MSPFIVKKNRVCGDQCASFGYLFGHFECYKCTPKLLNYIEFGLLMHVSHRSLSKPHIIEKSMGLDAPLSQPKHVQHTNKQYTMNSMRSIMHFKCRYQSGKRSNDLDESTTIGLVVMRFQLILIRFLLLLCCRFSNENKSVDEN